MGIGNGKQGMGSKEGGTGNREQGLGNREWGTGNEEQGTGNGEWGMGSDEQGTSIRYQENEKLHISYVTYMLHISLLSA